MFLEYMFICRALNWWASGKKHLVVMFLPYMRSGPSCIFTYLIYIKQRKGILKHLSYLVLFVVFYVFCMKPRGENGIVRDRSNSPCSMINFKPFL
jgi:uncharacterized membrane protein